MKKFVNILLIIIILISSIAFTACTDKPADEELNKENEQVQDSEKEDDQETDVTLKVAALKGPTGMGIAKLMDDVDRGSSKIKADFSIYGAPDELVGKIINGEVDIAAVPTNLASVLYNKTEGEVQLAAINTLGVLYIVETGDEITSIEDLKGKKIWASGKGATPDYVLKYILKENEIDPENDLEIDFTLQHAELAAAVASNDAPIALLPQPHVTTVLMKNSNARIALNMTEEWDKVVGDNSKLSMGCIVVNKKFAEENKDAINQFLNEYKASIEWVNANKEEAGALIEKYEILPNAKIAEKAIPTSNIVYIDGEEAKKVLEGFYKVLFDFNPKSLGGKIPDESFYYQK